MADPQKLREMRLGPNLLILCLLCGLMACGRLLAPDAAEILQKYLSAAQEGRHADAYANLSTEDKGLVSLGEYLKEYDATENPIAAAVTQNIKYEIRGVTETGNWATATVAVTAPDIGKIVGEALGAAFQSAFSKDGGKSAQDDLAKKFQSGNAPLKTTEETMRLVREQDGWKVFLDLKGKKLKEVQDKKVTQLLADAERLRKEKKFVEAISNYKTAAGMDAQNKDVATGLAETETEFRQEEEEQLYMQHLKLYDLKAKYYSAWDNDHVPGVDFKIKNSGDRSLDRVEVTVYFQDPAGVVIAEEKYLPVLVSKFNFSGDKTPLRPNYIYQMEAGKFYKADKVPTEWKEGAVTAKITDIDFSP